MTLGPVVVNCHKMRTPGQIGVAVGRAQCKKGLRVLNFSRNKLVPQPESIDIPGLLLCGKEPSDAIHQPASINGTCSKKDLNTAGLCWKQTPLSVGASGTGQLVGGNR